MNVPPTNDGRGWLCCECNAPVKDVDAEWRVTRFRPLRPDYTQAVCKPCHAKEKAT